MNLPAFLTPWIDQTARIVTGTPTWGVAAILLALLAIALISRQALPFLAMLVLAAAVLIIDRTASTGNAIAALLGIVACALLALVAIRSFYRKRSMEREMADMRVDLGKLQQAEHRRVMLELKQGQTQEAPASNVARLR